MDVSPRKKPTFPPRKATRTTPNDDDDDGDNFGAVNAPLGVSLLLRSVYTAGVAITTTSAVSLAQKTIDRLLSANADLPSVILRPFSAFKPSTSCHLRVAPDPDDLDATPRFDLLETWLDVLRKDKPEWEIVWQPLSEGKDKRMMFRIGEAGFKKEKGDKSSCSALEKVKTALTARGILVTDSYSLPTGSYIGLANHRHVDDILAAGAITAPALSPNPIPVMRCRQIEIEHCFELVVSGLSEGEGVQSSLCRWLTRNFRDSVTNDSFFVDARVDSFERDCMVFYMADWASTTRVLAAGEKLVSQFQCDSPSIHRPQLLLIIDMHSSVSMWPGVWGRAGISIFHHIAPQIPYLLDISTARPTEPRTPHVMLQRQFPPYTVRARCDRYAPPSIVVGCRDGGGSVKSKTDKSLDPIIDVMQLQTMVDPLPRTIWRLIIQDHFVDFEKLYAALGTGYDHQDEPKDFDRQC
ncbi:hypothetical protein B0H10DRAFT_2435209 [Mycena sp. CBHHK59/15]|nr:hypothetical protein B0H10DRAFT_2435209 [Mycena sp. CBHHK59/15]